MHLKPDKASPSIQLMENLHLEFLPVIPGDDDSIANSAEFGYIPDLPEDMDNNSTYTRPTPGRRHASTSNANANLPSTLSFAAVWHSGDGLLTYEGIRWPRDSRPTLSPREEDSELSWDETWEKGGEEDEEAYMFGSSHSDCEPHLKSRFSTSTTSTSNYIDVPEGQRILSLQPVRFDFDAKSMTPTTRDISSPVPLSPSSIRGEGFFRDSSHVCDSEHPCDTLGVLPPQYTHLPPAPNLSPTNSKRKLSSMFSRLRRDDSSVSDEEDGTWVVV